MILSANTELLRWIANLLFVVVCLLLVANLWQSLTLIQLFEQTNSTVAGGDSSASQDSYYFAMPFSFLFGGIGGAILFFSIPAGVTFLAWGSFHLFLDMYEALAEMQRQRRE